METPPPTPPHPHPHPSQENLPPEAEAGKHTVAVLITSKSL